MTAGAISVAALGLMAQPASAASTDCPSSKACLWTSENYPGSPNGQFSNSIVVSIGINSIVNNGNSNVARFYDANNHQGVYISLNNPARGGQTRDPVLSNGTNTTSANWSNIISSAQFV